MPRLIVLAGRALGTDFAVGSGAVLGRDPSCEVVLAGKSISRRHARLELRAGEWTVQDLGSRNGVRKDGQLGERFVLADHDEFHLGDLPLRFRTDGRGEGGVEIEGLERLDDPHSRARAVAGAAPRGRAASGERASGLDDVEPDERTQLLLAMRRESQAGLFSSELSQQPLGLRLLLIVLACALGAGMLWLAYQATLYLRAA